MNKIKLWGNYAIHILSLDFQILLPPIPQFKNESLNFIFTFWIFKSHYYHVQDQNIQLEI